MFFVGSGAFGYEESAYEKLKIIENTYPQGYIDTGNIAERLKGVAGSPYGTPSISAEASLYGKAMAKTIRMTENLYKDYDTELKIINETIARLKSSPKNIKYEMEARNLKLNILKSKLDVIKTIVDCNTKVKKSSEDDIKLMQSLNKGSIDGSLSPSILPDTIVGARTHMEGMVGMQNNTAPKYNIDLTGLEFNEPIPSSSVVEVNAPTVENKEVYVNQVPKESL